MDEDWWEYMEWDDGYLNISVLCLLFFLDKKEPKDEQPKDGHNMFKN